MWGGQLPSGQLAERHFELVKRVHAGLIHARVLAGWARRTCRRRGRRATDGSARTPPCCAAGQGGAAWGCPAPSPPEDDVAAAARGEVAAVVGELARRIRRFRRASSARISLILSELIPVAGRGQIDLQHPGIGRKAEGAHARIRGRRVALDPHWLLEVVAAYLRPRRPGRGSRRAPAHRAETRAGGLRGPPRRATGRISSVAVSAVLERAGSGSGAGSSSNRSGRRSGPAGSLILVIGGCFPRHRRCRVPRLHSHR